MTFEGNQSFTGRELSLHVAATPSDFSARLLGKRTVLYGAVFGTGLGLGFHGKDLWKSGLIGAAVGAGAGFIIGSGSGVERCLRQGILNNDVSSIRGFYGDQGFPDARVDTVTNVDGMWVDVTFRITEGAPVLIESARITPDSALADLIPRLNSRVGQRYSRQLIGADVDSIETRLQNIGYPEVRALPSITLPSTHTAVVELTIDRGPLARIGKITIERSGIDERRPVVDSQTVRDLLLFHEGDLYDASALFESQRRFYRIRSFLSAEVAPDVSHVHQDSLVDVTVNVVEDLTHRFSIEPGYGTLDCLRARAEYSNLAYRGGLDRIDVTGSVSKIGRARGVDFLSDFCRLQQDPEADISSRKVNYNATVRYSRPTPLRGGLLPSLSAYTERRGGYQAYMRTTDFGAALNLSKSITSSIVWDASYTFEYGTTQANAPVFCFVFRACDAPSQQRLEEPNRTAVIGTRFARDRRNFVDSASAGTFTRLDLRGSDPLVSDRNLQFLKGVADVGGYRRLLGGVVALRLRGGKIYGGVSDGFSRLPPEERLYAGGETSIRGVSQNELGPLIYVTEPGANDNVVALLENPDPNLPSRDSLLQQLRLRTIPTGGNAMFVANLEFRRNGPFTRSIQTIAFLDIGALSTEGGIDDVENKTLYTPGIALKWFSPIGPVQFNLAYNKYNDLAGPVYLSTGPNQESLTCLSGTSTGTPAGPCLSATAKANKTSFFKRLSFTIAFPPDF